MALHNRDYMGGVAPRPGDAPPGMGRIWRAYRVLIALNALVFLIGCTGWGEELLLRHALVSREALGAGRVWTLVLGGFFHLDLFHLLLVSSFIYAVGWRIEQERGAGTLVALYLLGSLVTGGVSLAVQRPLPERFTQTSTGSGFFVAPGLLLTNAHVVGQAREVEVQLAQGASFVGEVRATDPGLDLALVAVATTRPYLRLAPERPPVGRKLFALGYGSVGGDTSTLLQTSGELSGFNPERHWLHFQGRVNPGNSGGALVDGAGRWVGVVAAKLFRPVPGEESIGAAIDGLAVRAWLLSHGVQVEVSGVEPRLDQAPGPETLEALARLVVNGAGVAPSLGESELHARRQALDPWVFGASGAFFALVGFFCSAHPRREVLVLGNPVPLLILVGFAAVADTAGALRAYSNFHSWAHLYHLPAALAGVAALKLGLDVRLRGIARRREARARARAAERFTLLAGGGRASAPTPPPPSGPPTSGPSPGKLSPEEKARLDRVLAKVGISGLASLTAEERGFLDEASGKLRG